MPYRRAHQLLTLFALVGAPTALGAQQQPAEYALTGATLIDGTGAQPVANAVVIVRNGRIACAGTRAACPVPSSFATIDLRGRWLMPGLIDAHVHYAQTGWADGRPDALNMMQRFPYIETIAWLKDNPARFYRSYLCSGVTATFDVGGFPWTWSLRSAPERDPFAPHVAAAGPLLSTRDHWLNVPGERQFMHIATDSAADAGVRYVLGNRTDAVKVWFLAGANAPDADALAQRLMQIGKAAQRDSTPLIVHATNLWGAKVAVRAGTKLLVHSVEDRPVDDEFLQLAKQAGTIYTPTLVVRDGYRQLSARKFRADTYGAGLECVDPATKAKAFLSDSLPGGQNAEAIARAEEGAKRAFDLMAANVRAVHAAGIPIAVGTDAGNPLTLHGPSMYLEMEALQRAGLTAMDVIVAATRNGAAAMRRSRDLGTIERGKVADMIVLTADPTRAVANIRQLDRVIRGGTIHERRALLPLPVK